MALLGNGIFLRHYTAGPFVRGVLIFLVDKAFFVVDLDDSALCGERLDHVVGHVAHVIAKRAAGRMRGDERRFADLQRVVESFIADSAKYPPSFPVGSFRGLRLCRNR